ncbi:MAG TPA: HAMP domain-containing sensor histidine kinase [Vicinamibacterales bacterium]
MELSFDDHLTLNRLATAARLMSGATHEVNNALQVISGTVELLMASPDVPDTLLQALERIHAQSARAAAAMMGVAALSRPPSDTPKTLDLCDVVTRATALRRYAIGRAGLSVSLDAAPGPLLVRGNAAQLLQAVVNLIENAEQALAGQPGGRIEVAASVDGASVRVSIADNGPGLSTDVAERVFDPFVTTRPRTDSVGLGLPVARAIAGAHGGTLVAEPSAQGAAFALRIPRIAP